MMNECPDRRLARLLVAALVAAAAVVSTFASDPPHWIGATETTDCTSPCHVTHQAAGSGLTSSAGNVNLCQSCHNTNALPITNADKASPHVDGTSHAFDAAAVNATYNTQDPQTQAMFLRIMDNNVVCSTCHDQHSADAPLGGTPRISAASEVVDQGGSGTMTSGGTYTGSIGDWYLIDITQTGSDTTARYRYSKDNGTPTSWLPLGCSATDTTNCLTATQTPFEIENGVTVAFSGGNNTLQLGERWEFYASWPFLRAKLDQGDINSIDKFCRDCHRSWVMTHNSDLIGGGGVETWDGNLKSHPVGVGLDANSGGYDRATPLDGNGLAQNAGSSPDVDGNASNDLQFDGTNNVQCLSCHGVHYADSNTLTVDQP
jgi:predicted CXXCH cytochrome family protein